MSRFTRSSAARSSPMARSSARSRARCSWGSAWSRSRWRERKRMFAYSSIEHMGLITFAFGMGGPIASFAGLLHMTVHSLTKSAIFFTAGHAAQKAGTQVMDEIRGLVRVNPTVGWGLMLGTMAILGMPPFGIFASEFLIL